MENFTPYENAQFLERTLSLTDTLPKYLSLSIIMGGDFSVRHAVEHAEKPRHKQLVRQLGRNIYNSQLYLVNLWRDPTLTEIVHITETGDGWFQERWYKEIYSPESDIGSEILDDYATRLWRGIVRLEKK